MSDIALDGDTLVVRTPHRATMKQLGASWKEREGAWRLPATLANAHALSTSGEDFPDLSAALMPSWQPVEHPELYDYQRDAVGKLLAVPRGQIVVLSPGLGKTAVSIVGADRLVPPGEQVVVVSPAGALMRNWEREIRRWGEVPGDVYIMEGKVDYDRAMLARWIIVSWDKAVRERDLFTPQSKRKWPLWILDESVLVKSRRSQRFEKILKLRSGIDRVWLLSGNPTTRHADDLYTQLRLIWPRAFKSFWRFAERYCYVEEGPWAKTVTGTRSDRDVMADHADLITVVNQEDVLDLPEYLFEVVDVDLTARQRREYDRMSKTFVAELRGEQVVTQNEMGKLMKLQQITSWWETSAKHDALLDLLPSYEGPHLIWTHWQEGAGELTARLGSAGYRAGWVSGATSTAKRDAEIEAFKRGERDALVLSIGVGKFGHTLTNARTVHYVDKTWNADDYFQSLRRVRRIGLTHRPVVVTYRAPGTVDELVEDNLEGKLGGISKLTRSRLRELLNGLGREAK